MKVRTVWLVVPMILSFIVIIVSVLALDYFNVEKSTTGYDYKQRLFVKDEVGTVEITISDRNWNEILDDPTAEQYVEASVTINGETYDNVGVRAKGNSSLSSVASSDSERYSLKIGFSQYDSNQTYYGLDTLNLNNNFSDTTQMKEFVSYELMEQLGIVTPAHSYVKVMVNGEYYGLMLAVENVGEALAKTNYGSTEGFIFKPEGNGSDLAYISDNTEDYPGIFDEVKMNAKTAKNNSNIINMMKQISEGDTSSIDVDQIARYFALNTALVSMDSYQGSFKHNYYLYENNEGIFSVIPWDYNMSFGGFNMGGGGRPGGEQQDQPNGEANENNNPLQRPNNANGQQMQPPAMNGEQNRNDQNANGENNRNRMNGGGMGMGGGLMLNETFVTDSNINFSITEPVSGTTVDARPLLKIILEDEQARALYDSYLEKIATEILKEENVLAITTKLHDLLLDAVEEDPSKFSTTEQFIAGVSGEQSLPEFAKQRSESILKQLSGEIEGVSGAGQSGFGGGGMLNFGNGNQGGAPQMNGQVPNFNPQRNANEQQRQNRPQMNGGQMPPNNSGNGEQNAQGNPPNFNGEMPNFNGEVPNFNGEMPEFNGEMPNFGGGFPGGQGGRNEATNPVQAVITVAASLAILAVAIGGVLYVSRRKYKKG